MQRWHKFRAAAPAVALVACSAITGCEPMRSLGLRKDPSAGDSVYEQVVGNEPGDPEDPKSTFRRNRLPGGLSEEARQIEREFNVY